MTGMAPAAQYGLPPEPRGVGGVRRLSCAGAVAGRRGPWAVGPRPGFRGTGAEFEVVLVVAGAEDPGQSACRPDDDPPHVRRWTEEKVAA
ncbi:hypothetical protein ACFV2V_21185 [Streptomyces sp. NPDC059698]|uniref:hypothetical protein n=1 Tax=unclassified Streptomyces TaxID=2593676 RepID=UPI00093D2A9A|nr:hypothetical protein AMK24_12375 [Streptomyces sp. CB02366]